MKYNNKIQLTKTIGFNNNVHFHKLNEIGLNKAYESNNKTHVDNDTLYIAGTSNLRDVWDDITKIPFWGNIKNSQRYKQAEQVLNNNPKVKNIVSHSLGSSVALEFEKDNKDRFKTTTYGAPILQFGSTTGNRYRKIYDPVSLFDSGAQTIPKLSINPHSYSDFT